MCRCLSAVVLKWALYIVCLITLGMGPILIWAGILAQSSLFIQIIDYSYIGFIIILAGLLLVFVAFIGIIGA